MMAFAAPDEYFSRVEMIDAEELVARGFTTVLLDIDNTLVPRGTNDVPASVITWINSLKEQGLRICLVSNNWHRVVFDHAHALDLPLVYKAMKPAPFAFGRAIRKANEIPARVTGLGGVDPAHSPKGKRRTSVMIGDQLFTDILGARLTGMHAILVVPQAKKDLWYTLILRRLEHLLLGDLRPTR